MDSHTKDDIQQIDHCAHCSVQRPITTYNQEGDGFCCHGCLVVFKIIHSSGLENIYSIQRKDASNMPQAKNSDRQFNYLSNLEYIKDNGELNTQEQWSMKFYLQDIQCLACLWLIENIDHIENNVAQARMNIAESTVHISLKKGHDFSSIAKRLYQFGFNPIVITNEAELEKQQTNEEHSLLIKIGIAAFCSMNIMLYSYSVYFGAEGFWSYHFGLISLTLCLPVVFFSALPLYKSAYMAFKNKSINLDTPLSLAIFLGFSASVYNSLRDQDHYYFDSISTLVFLILFSRYILMKARKNTLNKGHLASFFTQGVIRKKIDNDNYLEISLKEIKENDKLIVYRGENLPADGILLSDKSYINKASLTGEALPEEVTNGSEVFMGTQCQSKQLEFKVTHRGNETKIGKIIQYIENEHYKKSTLSFITDDISRYFLKSVLFITISLFIILSITYDFETALNRSLALIIITCPCALALATPLTFSRMLRLAYSKGLIFKNEQTLENLAKAKNIFFDKTGTLTTGEYNVESFELLDKNYSNEQIKNIIYYLEAPSHHPVAKSLRNWAQGQHLKKLEFDNWKEVTGKGIFAYIDNQQFSITSKTKNTQLSIELKKNDHIIARLLLKDILKKNSTILIQELKRKKMNLFLLSGDHRDIVMDLAKELDLDINNVFFEQTPKNKAQKVYNTKNSVLIGDGLNDALAFSAAQTSIAVKNAMEVSLKTADIVMAKDDINGVLESFKLANKAVLIVKKNLVFSLSYNVIGAFLAISGLITPLWAAILMPISSICVTAHTLISTQLKKEDLNGSY